MKAKNLLPFGIGAALLTILAAAGVALYKKRRKQTATAAAILALLLVALATFAPLAHAETTNCTFPIANMTTAEACKLYFATQQAAAQGGQNPLVINGTVGVATLDTMFGKGNYRCFPDRQDLIAVVSWPTGLLVENPILVVDQPYRTVIQGGWPYASMSASAYLVAPLTKSEWDVCEKIIGAPGKVNLELTLAELKTAAHGTEFVCFADRLDAVYVASWLTDGTLDYPYTKADLSNGTKFRGDTITAATSATLWLEGKLSQTEWDKCTKKGAGKSDVSSSATRLDAFFGTTGWVCFRDRLNAAYVLAWPAGQTVTYPVTTVNLPTGDVNTGATVTAGTSATIWLDVPLLATECHAYKD